MSATKRPQPGKNPTIRTQRRRIIAEKIVKQVGPAAIAKQIGISRQMVNVEIRAPETQGFIRGALAPYLDEIGGLMPAVLLTLEQGLAPDQPMPDRLRAVRTTGYVMELADGRKSDGDVADRPERFAGTLEELLVLYRRTTTAE